MTAPDPDIPLATPDDVRVPLHDQNVTFTWNGKRFWVIQRALTWPEETELIARGAYYADFVNYWLSRLVKESSIPMATDKDRLAWTPAFGNRLTEELGILAAYKSLGLDPTKNAEDQKNG